MTDRTGGSGVTYRDATPADIPAIDALFRRSFTDTFAHLYTPADLAAFLAQFTREAWAGEFATMRFRLAESDGRAIGYAKLSALTLPAPTPEPGAMELRQLYVLRDHHGAGVAAELMRWTIATARADGAPALYLAVFMFNDQALAFYARHGFVDVGAYAFRVGDQVDEDRMMRLQL